METTASASTCHFVPVFPYRPDMVKKRPQLPQGPRGFPGLPEDWLAEFETYKSEDGEANLFAHLYRNTRDDNEVAHRALVVLHGQGEHSGRYVHWPHYLHSKVGSIYAPDHRGHGQSSGARGHISHFDLYAHDAARAIRRYDAYLKASVGRSEIHLVGHSMGGLIAMRTMLLHPDLPVKSVALSAPMIQLAFQLPKIKELASRLALAIAPNIPLPTEPLAHLVSRDPAVVEHYKADKLNHGLASAAFFYSYLTVKADTLGRGGDFKVPMQMMLPLADRIIEPQATQDFFATLPGSQNKLLVYPQLFHEIFNEPEKEQIFTDLRFWIKSHAG